jgi:hypothetical protein
MEILKIFVVILQRLNPPISKFFAFVVETIVISTEDGCSHSLELLIDCRLFLESWKGDHPSFELISLPIATEIGTMLRKFLTPAKRTIVSCLFAIGIRLFGLTLRRLDISFPCHHVLLSLCVVSVRSSPRERQRSSKGGKPGVLAVGCVAVLSDDVE